MDKKVRQKASWDPLSERLNKGPEVHLRTIYKKSVMSHNGSLRFYWCLWNRSVSPHLSFFYHFAVAGHGPGSARKHAPLQPPVFFHRHSLSFHGKYIWTHLFAANSLILSPSLLHLSISLCLILARWGHLSRNIIYH